LHIFCDESGGADPANEFFLVAAIAMPATDAARLIKSFRKAAKWPRGEEIKGHALSPAQRDIFFDLVRRTPINSITVACNRRDAVGGWAMGTLAELDLYSHLLCEACLAMPKPDGDAVTITPDGGRYKKVELAAISARLSAAITQAGAKRASVSFQNSTELAGLQIADVIANSVFQSMGASPLAEHTAQLLRPLIEAGRLVTKPITLPGIRPAWLCAV
jgi:hypothetical protein